MFEQKNIWQFTKNFAELERIIDTGYVDPSVMFKVDKFARTVLQNNVLQLVSSFNNLNPFLDTPSNLYLASDSTNDTFEVVIEYIDQNRDKQIMNVNLTGTTPVDLGSDIYCVFRMYNNNGVDQVGTRVVVTSNATGIPIDDTEVYCDMIVTSGVPAHQSLTGIFSVPRNYSAFVTKASISADKGSDLKGAFFIRQEGKVFRFVKALETFQQQSVSYDMFERAKEKTDFRPIAIAQTGGLAYFEYTIVCIHNDYLDKHLK